MLLQQKRSGRRHYRTNPNVTDHEASVPLRELNRQYDGVKNDDSNQSKSSVIGSSEGTVLSLTVCFMLFLGAIGYFLSASSDSAVHDFSESDPEGYREWILSEEEMEPKTLEERVDSLLAGSDGKTVGESVMSMLDEHCLNELAFNLFNDEMDFLLIQIEQIVEHLVERKSVSMDRDIDGHFVVTKEGQIVDTSDPLIAGGTTSDHGPCSLIDDLMNRMTTDQLIDYSVVGPDRVPHDGMTAVFSSRRSASIEEMWNDQFQSLFSLQNENRDIATLIEASSPESDYGAQSVHIMTHYLLHSHCASVLEHLRGPFQRTMFIEAVTSNLVQRQNIEMKADEVPMVDEDGAIFIGRRPYHYGYDRYGYDHYEYGYERYHDDLYRYDYGGDYGVSSEYRTCPFLGKLMNHHFGGIDDQIRSALGVFDEFIIFEEKMAVLLEEQCRDSVIGMERNLKYHSMFRDRMRSFIESVMATESISKHQRFAVDVLNGDIIAVDDDNEDGAETENENDHLIDCPVVNRIVKMFGIDHRVDTNSDSTDSDDERDAVSDSLDTDFQIDNLSPSEIADLILGMAPRHDLNLRKLIERSLDRFHSEEIRLSHYPSSYEMVLYESAVLIEQFVFDLLFRVEVQRRGQSESIRMDSVFVLDTASMTAMDVKRDEVDSDQIHRHWIQIPFMNHVLESIHREQRQKAVHQEIDDIPSDSEPAIDPSAMRWRPTKPSAVGVTVECPEKEGSDLDPNCEFTEDLEDKKERNPISIESEVDGVTADSDSSSDSKAEMQNDREMVDLVKMIAIDLKKREIGRVDIASEFDEDVDYGLNAFCGEVMEQLSSFQKRRLRREIFSKVLGDRSMMEQVVVTSEGEIVSFDDVSSIGTPFWKCPFIEALIMQI